MSSFEAVIDRMKQEGDLTRNSGTNSLKQINTTLKDILNSIEKNIKLSQTPVPAASISRVPSSPRAESRFQTERTGGILAGLSAAVTAQTIGRLGIGQSGIAQKQRERADDFLGKVTFRETRKNIAEKLFSFSDAKEATEEANEPIVDELKNQTSVIQVLVDTFKKGMDEDKRFREEQEDLAAQDRSDQLNAQGPAGPTAEPKEKDKGIFGTILGMLGSGLGGLGEILKLLTNPKILLVIAALSGLFTLWKKWDNIKQSTQGIIDFLKEITGLGDLDDKKKQEMQKKREEALQKRRDDEIKRLEERKRELESAGKSTAEIERALNERNRKNKQIKSVRSKDPKELQNLLSFFLEKNREPYNEETDSFGDDGPVADVNSRSSIAAKQLIMNMSADQRRQIGVNEFQKRMLLESGQNDDDGMENGEMSTFEKIKTSLGNFFNPFANRDERLLILPKDRSDIPPILLDDGSVYENIIPRNINQQLGQGSAQRPIVVNNVSAPTTVDASTNAPTTVNGGGNGGYSAPPARKTQIMYDNFGPSA